MAGFGSIHKRKSEHIRIALNEKVTGERITTGFERVRFLHNALPEIDFQEISLATEFLGYKQKTPFLISSMTGGAELASTINRNLATAAEERGWIFALGSTRALIESKEYRSSFQVREFAPNTPIIANLGAVQLNYGFGVEECKEIVKITDADIFVLHLNSIQEVVQDEGDTNFKQLLPKIAKLCEQLEIPVGVKEVGWGIDGAVAVKLFDAGVAYIDVAGAGGTSWSQIEKLRSKDEIRKEAAGAFADWGIPTVECILSIREKFPDKPLIASGGIQNGMEAAKALALGADLVGIARGILKAATQSVEEVLKAMEIRELELKMAMFGVGAATIQDLQKTDRLIIES